MNAPRNPLGFPAGGNPFEETPFDRRKGTRGGTLIERAAGSFGLNPVARAAARPGAQLPTNQRPLPERPPSNHPQRPAPAAFATPRAHAPNPVARAAVPPARPATPRADAVAIDRKRLTEEGMIVPGAAVSVLAEEFRLVKRQLLLTARKLRDEPAKARTVLVCSARPDEGKTFCAINLGISLAAERETEVLLIDGDFAKRDLMPRLGLANGRGFLDALADPRLDPESLVVATDIPQLSLLGAGTRTNDDTELLASERTKDVIARLLAADPNRIIVFDSPPALAASPAAVFALHCGQVMVVVRADATGEDEIRDAVALLDGCDHIQLVLNQVRHRPSGYRFGDYYAPQENPK